MQEGTRADQRLVDVRDPTGERVLSGQDVGGDDNPYAHRGDDSGAARWRRLGGARGRRA